MTTDWNLYRRDDTTPPQRGQFVIVIPTGAGTDLDTQAIADLFRLIQPSDFGGNGQDAPDDDAVLIHEGGNAFGWSGNILPRLIPDTPSGASSRYKIVRRNYDGDGWEVVDFPTADQDDLGGVRFAQPSQLGSGNPANDVAITPQDLWTALTNRILPTQNPAVRSGQVLAADGGGGVHFVSPQSGESGAAGHEGWTPVLSVYSDGERRVLRLTGYVGGGGATPTQHVGDFVGATGYVSSASQAIDIRGAAGRQGNDGAAGSAGAAGDAGADAYAQALYARTSTATAPAQPTSASGDAIWGDYAIPSGSQYSWLAFRTGTGTPSGAWAVILLAPPSGSSGSGTVTPSDHRRWLAWGNDATFSAGEMTSGISADSATLTQTRAIPIGDYVAVWSAQPLTRIASPFFFGDSAGGNEIGGLFSAQSSPLRIASTDGRLYVSVGAMTNPIPAGTVWTLE